MTEQTTTDAPPERKPDEPEAAQAPKTLVQKVWGEIAGFAKAILFFLPFYFVFTTAAFGNYVIPSESMVPSLEVGDRIVVNKFAYGYSRHSLPLNIGLILPASDHRLFETMPQRGDVVVFIHPRTGETLIKRLIGLPGDEIAVRDGRLYINGAAVALSDGELMSRRAYGTDLEEFTRYEETLPNGVRHPIDEALEPTILDNYGPYVVPPRHVFFMGDNRDKSRDSRADLGPVPIENLVGRAETVYWAQPNCSGPDCRERERFLRPFHD